MESLDLDAGAIATLIPVTAVFFCGLALLSRTAIGQVIAQRLRGNASRDVQLEAELQTLRDEMEALRRELGETQERLDFAERVLTRGGESASQGRP